MHTHKDDPHLSRMRSQSYSSLYTTEHSSDLHTVAYKQEAWDQHKEQREKLPALKELRRFNRSAWIVHIYGLSVAILPHGPIATCSHARSRIISSIGKHYVKRAGAGTMHTSSYTWRVCSWVNRFFKTREKMNGHHAAAYRRQPFCSTKRSAP